MRPPEQRELVQKLRADGVPRREIAKQTGVPESTITRWLNPQFEEAECRKARKRRFSKGRKCQACGKQVTNDATMCRACFLAGQRFWTRVKLVRAVREWAAEHGEQPRYIDWERSGKTHPAWSSVKSGPNPPFRKWADLMEAAGFKPRVRGKNRRLSPAQRAKIRRGLREEAIRTALERNNEVQT